MTAITAATWKRLKELCDDVGAEYFDMLSVLYAESGFFTTAHNPSASASGLNQLMADTAAGLGWDRDDCYPSVTSGRSPLARYRSLSYEAQLEWVHRYFANHRGKLINQAAIYTCNFLPSDLHLAADPQAVLVQKDGRRGWAYTANAGLDANGDYIIRVHELTDAIRRSCVGTRWNTLTAEFRSFLGMPPVGPVMPPMVIDLGIVAGQQRGCILLGVDPGPVDNVLGPKTRQGIRSAQALLGGLAVDGIFGPATRTAFRAALPGAVY